jgi:hypothetical protein
MQTTTIGRNPGSARLWRLAGALALITIFYNVAEGLVSVFFGLEDETVALFGFGLDSFVEVISGVGVWHMIRPRRGFRPRQVRAEGPEDNGHGVLPPRPGTSPDGRP